jgi:hypothetical protein
MRLWLAISLALLMVGCGAPPPPQPIIHHDPWTGTPDALPCSTSIITQLPNVLRGGLRDAYVSALNEDLPEEWAR